MLKRVAYIRSSDIYNDSRATKEILALEQAGHQITVLAWNRSGKAEKECASVFCSKNIVFEFYNVPIPCGIGVKNIGKLFGFFKWVKKTLKKNVNSIDIIHACDLDGALGAYNFCIKNEKPLVYDIYDYYIDSHYVPRALLRIVETQEIKIINKAYETIICTDERREQIAKAKPKHVSVIHNSPDITEISHENEIYDYVYCGAFGPGRLIEEVLLKYPDNNDLLIQYAGYGHLVNEVRIMSEKEQKFSYRGSIKYSDVLKLESQSKVLSAIYEPTIRNHRLCAPNKFYEALALGKPLIVCRGTGIDRIVEQNNIGIVIDYNAQEFYDALRKLCVSEATRREMGVRARKLYEEKYSWSIMKRRLTEIYSAI